MAGQLRLKLDVIELTKKATGSNIDKRDAYLKVLANEQIKREFGKRCIDSIIERTLEGKDKKGNPWSGRAAKYSESYKQSDEFRIYGKSPSVVNLKLTGDMQAAIDVVAINSRSVTLGFIGQEENDKAHGHVNGANYLPVRDFWGIPEKDQIAILKETIKDFINLKDIQISQVEQTIINIGGDENITQQEINTEFFNG